MSRWQWGVSTGFLFPCPAPSYTIDSFPGELVWVPRGPIVESGDGACGAGCETVPCLFLPYESARFLIIFFHANAEDLGRSRWFCHFLRDQFQVHVLAVEYPGYGVCPGKPTKEGVVANAHAALHFVTQALGLPLEQVKVFGRSIGTAPALHLASKFKVSGVILVSPFLNTRTMFSDWAGPVGLLCDEWFRNDEAILRVSSPTLFIHGQRDLTISCRHSEVLYELCQSRKLFISPSAMEHNDNITKDISYLIVPMFRFFALPDYSFQEFKVPGWAFDKRRSPLYVRPTAEVCSHAGVPSSAGKGSSGISVPDGDEEEWPVQQDQEAPQPRENSARRTWEGIPKSAPGDQPVADSEASMVLTHPTVRHAYSATKRSYKFGGADDARAAGLDACEEHRPEEMMRTLSRRPLGDHRSASTPPSAPASPAASPRRRRQPGSSWCKELARCSPSRPVHNVWRQ